MVAELVCLVNQHQVVFVGVPIVVVVIVENLRKATIAHKLRVFVDAEILEGGFPVLLHRRRIDHENLRVVTTILNQEFLGNHRGDDRLAKTNHIGEEETIVAN